MALSLVMAGGIICVCGRVWRVQRFALSKVCEDEAICVCGQSLKRWKEAADYIFEPDGTIMPLDINLPPLIREGWPRVRAAEVHREAHRRLSREH